MEKQHKLFMLLIGIVIMMTTCKSNTEHIPVAGDNIVAQTGSNPGALNNNDPKTHKVKVEEVIQTTQYTYLRVSEEDSTFWIAIQKREVEAGRFYYYINGLEMTDFESRELNRTFESIYFVQEIREDPITHDKSKSTVPTHDMPGTTGEGNAGQTNPPHDRTSSEKMKIDIKLPEDCTSIAELFSNRNSYSQKTVTVYGQVVKVNNGIMGKNWIHIQDGTNDPDNFDLTVTTQDEIKIGDIVKLKGIINLNKDFGYGYAYELIMEDAKLINK